MLPDWTLLQEMLDTGQSSIILYSVPAKVKASLKVKRAKHSPSVVVHPADPLAQIADEPPQLLVVDMSLADMTGLQVCLQLCKSQDTVDIPVVMLAGRDQIYPNPDAYIVKPIDVPSLLSCVAEVMHGGYLFTPGAFSRDCWISP